MNEIVHLLAVCTAYFISLSVKQNPRHRMSKLLCVKKTNSQVTLASYKHAPRVLTRPHLW